MTTRFMLLSPSRSGSSMVRTMLDSHPEICSHGEVFAKKRVNMELREHPDLERLAGNRLAATRALLLGAQRRRKILKLAEPVHHRSVFLGERDRHRQEDRERLRKRGQ